MVATSINDVQSLGRTIRHLRQEQGLTQAQLAQKAGVSRTFVIDLEEGHPRAQLGKVLNILTALNTVPQLVSGPSVGRAAQLSDILAEWNLGRLVPDQGTQLIVEQYINGTIDIDEALAQIDALPPLQSEHQSISD